MSALEAQLLLTRVLVLMLLYAFLAAVAWIAWRDLGHARRQEEAARPETCPRLIVLDAGTSDQAVGSSFPVDVVTSLGRDMDNDIVIADATVSGRHGIVVRHDGAWWIEDLGSRNGTCLNGTRLSAATPDLLRSGDVLQLGAVRLRIVIPEMEGPAA